MKFRCRRLKSGWEERAVSATWRALPRGGKATVARRTNQSSPFLAWMAPLSIAVIVLGLWWMLTTVRPVEAWVFPTPNAFFERLVTLLSQSWMWQRIAVTSGEAVIGAVFGTVVALPLAWGIFNNEFVRAGVEPFLGATQAIPAIAIAPLLVLWMGNGFTPIIVLCALITFFPVLVSTTVGLRQMDTDVLDAAALDGASGWAMIYSIEAPLAAPAILAGIRNGFALSVTGAIVGEMVMGGAGLGQVLTQQRHNLDTAGMFVTVFILATMAMILYGLIYSAERRARRDVSPSRHDRPRPESRTSA